MKRYLSTEFIKELKFLEELEEKSDTDSDIIRRLFVRSIFAAIESGISDWLQNCKPKLIRSILNANSIEEVSEKTFALSVVDNFSFRIDDKGNIKRAKAKVPTSNLMLFSINIISQCNETDFNPKEINGWKDLLEAMKVRDRITHPKTIEDLLVNDQEYKKCKSAINWFAEYSLKASGTFDTVMRKYT